MFRFDDTIWRKVFAFLTTVAVAVFIIFVVIYTYDATPYENIHILDDNWDIEVNGEKYYDVTLTNFIFTDQKRGDDISFTTTMPEIICSQPYMQLRVWNSSIEVRLDNDVLYTFGKETMGQGGVVGGGSRWFSLPDDFSGKKLTIDL